MRTFISKMTCFLAIVLCISNEVVAQESIQKEPMAQGIYEPTWESLAKYEVPDWFRDAKFGIWAHWGPQCEPESGDWYARHMYYPGEWQHNVHLEKYGNPANFGFKDVINIWKADKWDPDSLVRFYKSVGARYFMALANHHDNFDLWDSKYQPWNSVNMGPKKNIVGGWAEACKKYGLPLGVSVHASHAWTWLEGSQDYDGKLTKEDGKGQWWEGYDPQDLYEQEHPRSVNSKDVGAIHGQWAWGNGAAQPTEEYKTKIYNRTVDLINKYNPDIIYYDDTAVPFYPISNEGVEMTTHHYNKSLKDNNGEMRAVALGKILNEKQKDCMVWDVERGIPDRSQEKAWQTCTCLGSWHYDRGVYNNNGYKSAAQVIKMLVDIVSKNGNLLLSVPVRGDGSIDEKEVAILKDIKAWMDINSESIYGTRPWGIFGEGPNAESSNPLNNQGFNEGANYVAEDIRFAEKDGVVYVTALGWSSNGTIRIKNLSSVSPYYASKISKVELLGYGAVDYICNKEALVVVLPSGVRPNYIAPVLKVSFGGEPSKSDLDELTQTVKADLDVAKQYLGSNTGQYDPFCVEQLENAYNAAVILDNPTAQECTEAYAALKTAYAQFKKEGKIAGGAPENMNLTQNITRKYLKESRNFSRSDEGEVSTSRFGLLAEPWVVTPNIINQDGFTKGGFDGYESDNDFSGKSISVQKWYNTDPAIEDGKIYQVTTLQPGSYYLSLSVHEQYGLRKGEVVLSVSPGTVLPDMSDVESTALAYYDMSSSATGGSPKCCYFTLEEETEVCIGWTVDIDASATSKSMRVKRIRLYCDGKNVSSTYLTNNDRIKRKDVSYRRFGVPEHWTVCDFNVPQSNGDGVKQGIDKYPGYNTLMLGVWNDRSYSLVDLSKARIYKEVTLPAGTYYFGAAYQTIDQLNSAHIFMSYTLPEKYDLSEFASYSSVKDAATNGSLYGINFTLTEEKTVYLGWIADLSKGSTTQEFRVSEIALLRFLDGEKEWISAEGIEVGTAQTCITPREWAKQEETTPALGVGDEAYVTGNEATVVNLGIIDLTDVEKVKVNMTYTDELRANSSFSFHLDGDVNAWVTLPIKKTMAQMFPEQVETECPSVEGVYDVTMEWVNQSSRVFSVLFQKKSGSSVNKPHADNGTAWTFSVNKNMVTVNSSTNAVVRLYSLDGRELLVNNHVQGTLLIQVLNSGVYVLKVNNKAQKIRIN